MEDEKDTIFAAKNLQSFGKDCNKIKNKKIIAL